MNLSLKLFNESLNTNCTVKIRVNTTAKLFKCDKSSVNKSIKLFNESCNPICTAEITVDMIVKLFIQSLNSISHWYLTENSNVKLLCEPLNPIITVKITVKLFSEGHSEFILKTIQRIFEYELYGENQGEYDRKTIQGENHGE